METSSDPLLRPICCQSAQLYTNQSGETSFFEKKTITTFQWEQNSQRNINNPSLQIVNKKEVTAIILLCQIWKKEKL